MNNLIKKTIVLIIVAFAGITFYLFNNQKDSNDPVIIATEFVKKNSVKDLEFSLSEVFREGDFVKYEVDPKETYIDITWIYLKKDNETWEVIGFGTAFPELYTKYPQLNGK